MARGGDPPEPPGAGLRPAGPPVPGLRPAGCLAIPVLADGKRRVYGLWRPPGAGLRPAGRPVPGLRLAGGLGELCACAPGLNPVKGGRVAAVGG